MVEWLQLYPNLKYKSHLSEMRIQLVNFWYLSWKKIIVQLVIISEAYSKSTRTSKMELFVKRVNGWKINHLYMLLNSEQALEYSKKLLERYVYYDAENHLWWNFCQKKGSHYVYANVSLISFLACIQSKNENFIRVLKIRTQDILFKDSLL